ncbi:SAP30-binding protein, partial [Phenoliferia sp. Uapishka_3]
MRFDGVAYSLQLDCHTQAPGATCRSYLPTYFAQATLLIQGSSLERDGLSTRLASTSSSRNNSPLSGVNKLPSNPSPRPGPNSPSKQTQGKGKRRESSKSPPPYAAAPVPTDDGANGNGGTAASANGNGDGIGNEGASGSGSGGVPPTSASFVPRVQMNSLAEFGVPPMIAGPCNPSVEAKLAKYHELAVTRGLHFNDSLSRSKAFRNPRIYTKLVEFVKVDEKGTCWSKDVWDPMGLPPDAVGSLISQFHFLPPPPKQDT